MTSGPKGGGVNITASSAGHFRLTNNSTQDDALAVFNSVKAELSDKINQLNNFKRDVIRSEQVEISAKSRLRITIESLLIDLNEEIFALSEQLAKAFTDSAV